MAASEPPRARPRSRKEERVKIFIDTADVREIREAKALGVLDGVTTNPTLVAKTGRPFDDVIREICDLVPGPVSAEAVADTYDDFMKEAHRLAKLAPNVVVKLPTSEAGLKACKTCSGEGIKTNMTLIFQPLQALLCAKAGATYVSPFVGRLDDMAEDGMAMVGTLCQVFANYSFPTEVLVASIRHPVHVVRAALMGAHVATIPLNVISQLLKHPLTDAGIARFNADFAKIPRAPSGQ
jgi:transaldolase